MSEPVQRILSALKDVHQIGERWQARCPVHDDDKESLCVGQGDDGRALVHCQAGCATTDVLAALGLTMKDLFSRNGKSTGDGHASGNGSAKREIVAVYNYTDEAGELLFQAVRFEPKGFAQRRPKDGGGFDWSVKGVRQVAYRLPEIVAADASKIIFVPEGEKDADRLVKLGLPATCNAGGAGKWKACHAEPLAGRRVAVLVDNDKAGRDHGRDVAMSLQGLAASVKLIALPSLPVKGDVSDWFDAGHDVDELLSIVEATAEWEPRDEGEEVEYLSPIGDVLPATESQAHRPGKRFPLTDSGNAERLVHLFGDRVRYCHPWAKWLAWDGKRWAFDLAGEVQQLAKQTARDVLREASEAADEKLRDALIAHARRSESAAGRANMLKCAQSETGIPVMPEQLDRDPWALNVENGTLDLRSGELRPHSKADRITKLAPVAFDPVAQARTFRRFLSEIFGDDNDLISYVQRFLGHCLTGDVSEQILNIWYGVGANGKSTLVNAIMNLMGPDYAMKAASDMLLTKRGMEHPTALTDLHGKRLVACVETDDGRRLAESLTKELTGGDPIRARRMREDYWQFMPSHKVVLACNHRPVVRGTDHAMWRRIKLVPFNVVIDAAQRDRELPAKLKAERVGILTWLATGCLDWQTRGLGEPEAVKSATAKYAEEEDVFGQFLAECCVFADWARIKASSLVDAYIAWGGDKRTKVQTMTPLLEKRGVERYPNNGTWYHGVGLSDNGSTEARKRF